jgi:hypothetical protein
MEKGETDLEDRDENDDLNDTQAEFQMPYNENEDEQSEEIAPEEVDVEYERMMNELLQPPIS